VARVRRNEHEHGFTSTRFQGFQATLKKSGPSFKPSDTREEALQSALRFLGYRARSEAEVMTYLVQRGYSTTSAEAALEKLRSLNYINDESFARAWASSKLDGRGHGPRRIARDLRSKGIAEALVREIVRDLFQPQLEAQTARLWLEKRFSNKNFEDPKIARRAAAFLQRKGYSGQVIFDLLNYSLEDD
jgi:regulatory protein